MDRFQMFTVLIAKIARYIHKIKTLEMAEFGLKSWHLSCLYYLYCLGSLTAKQLCSICQEDKASISRAIEFLKNNGYVVCSTDGKRYNSLFTLTKKGYDVGERLAKKINDILSEAGEGISETERTLMYDSLKKISDNLQKIIVDEE